MVTTRFSSPIPDITTGGGAPNQIYEKPVPLKSDAKNLIVKLANRMGTGNGPASFTADVAVYTSNGLGQATGAPLAYWPGVLIPNDGSVWTSPAIPDPVLGSDGKVVVVYQLPAGVNSVLVSNVAYGWISVSAADQVFPPPALLNLIATSNQLLQLMVDYDTNHTRIVELGDSLSFGQGTPAGFLGAPFNQLSYVNDLACEILGFPGNSLAQLAVPATYPTLWDGLIDSSVNALVIEVGLTDLSLADLTNMENQLTAIVNHARALGVQRVFTRTIAPNATYPGSEAVRLAFNSWLRSNVVGADGIYDAAAAAPVGLADPSNLANLLPAYTIGGTPLSDAGQTAEAMGWETIFFDLTLAAEYHDGVWPPLYYPAYPLPPGWPSDTPQLVPFTPSSSIQAPEALPLPAPPTVLPPATVESFDFEAAELGPNETTYVDPNITQSQIDAFFRIVKS